MKHVTLAVLLVLLCAIPAFGQSTTVSGQVTDGGGQSWNNGTITFTFLPNPAYPSGPYSWTGGAFNPYQTYNSALNGTGGYSALSVPSSSAITPTGTQWKVTVCAQATAPCYSTTAILS